MLIISNINFPDDVTVPSFTARSIPAPPSCRVVPREPADTGKTGFVKPLPLVPGDRNSRARRFTGYRHASPAPCGAGWGLMKGAEQCALE